MEKIFGSDVQLSEDTRLIKRLYKEDSSERAHFIFALQYLFMRKNEWVEVARVDNYEHGLERTGVHIHKFGTDFVEFREMSFTEAENFIIAIAEKIKQRIVLGGDYGEN